MSYQLEVLAVPGIISGALAAPRQPSLDSVKAAVVIAVRSLKLRECSYCEERIAGEVLQHDEEVSYLGRAKANAYCSLQCRDQAAEDAHERRYSYH